MITQLVADRWEDVATEADGIKKALTESFAYLSAVQVSSNNKCSTYLQPMYGEYGCDVIDAGENMIKGPLVIAWQKDFVYGPLLDY